MNDPLDELERELDREIASYREHLDQMQRVRGGVPANDGNVCRLMQIARFLVAEVRSLRKAVDDLRGRVEAHLGG